MPLSPAPHEGPERVGEEPPSQESVQSFLTLAKRLFVIERKPFEVEVEQDRVERAEARKRKKGAVIADDPSTLK